MKYLYPALILGCLSAPLGASAQCTMPVSLSGRQMTNQSDPLYQIDNPNAGRLVQLELGDDHYRLRVLANDATYIGTYHYALLAPDVAELRLTEQHPEGQSRYRLLMTCLHDRSGRFVFTQHDGPVAPRQRQNGGTWALTR